MKNMFLELVNWMPKRFPVVLLSLKLTDTIVVSVRQPMWQNFVFVLRIRISVGSQVVTEVLHEACV